MQEKKPRNIYYYEKINFLLQQLKANKVQIEMIEFYHNDQHKNQVLVFDKDHRIYNYYLSLHICPKKIQIIRKKNLCYNTWKNRVWKRVNAQPIRRSSSCRASTDNDWFLSGYPRLLNACRISLSVIELNFARRIFAYLQKQNEMKLSS